MYIFDFQKRNPLFRAFEKLRANVSNLYAELIWNQCLLWGAFQKLLTML